MQVREFLNTQVYKEPTFTFEGWEDLDSQANGQIVEEYSPAEDLNCIKEFLNEFYSQESI